MISKTYTCEHTCRNTCAALTKVMQNQGALAKLYEEILQQCDEPEVREFVNELASENSAVVARIMQKLNEIRARSLIYDGITSSFNA